MPLNTAQFPPVCQNFLDLKLFPRTTVDQHYAGSDTPGVPGRRISASYRPYPTYRDWGGPEEPRLTS